MSKRNYRTLDGLYKALVPLVNTLPCEYQIEKNRKDLAIYSVVNGYDVIAMFVIEDLLPVLRRAQWLVRYDTLKERVELLVWLHNDTI